MREFIKCMGIIAGIFTTGLAITFLCMFGFNLTPTGSGIIATGVIIFIVYIWADKQDKE